MPRVPLVFLAPEEEHPILRVSLVARLVWRLWTERLTQPGRWFLVATVAFTAFGSFSLDLQAYIPWSYATSLWLVALVGLVFSRPRVRLQARHADRVTVGEALPVSLEVEYLGRTPAVGVSVVPHRPHSSITGDLLRLKPIEHGQRQRATLLLRCRRRGVFHLRGYRVESGFPFGLLNASRTFPHEEALVVYPDFHPLTRLRIPTARRYQPGGVALASTLGEAMEYIGNRDYREGDSVRDIDWRATARLNRPIVREYREEYFLRVAVILDTHVPKGASAARKQAFERAVSLSAAVSDFMAREEYLVDLFAAGPNLYHLTAGRSLAYLDQILEILACVEDSEEEPFSLLEPAILENLANITAVVCVLLDWDEPRRAFVESLRRGGASLRVIVAHDGPCTLDPAEDAATFGEIPVITTALYAAGIEEL
jgi:uncharacterized protein (DUF58 family)